jgi:8-oxo-dGTP diphosphatase
VTAPTLIVVAAVIESGGRVLIGKRRHDESYGGKWEFPGGKVEPGEAPRAALARELAEELAIDAEIAEEMDRYPYEYPGRAPIELIFFRVPRYAGEARNLTFAEIRWVERRRLTEFDFLEGDIEFVARLAGGA